MPSQAMQDAIDALRDRQKAGASQVPPTLAERRAGFTPGDRRHPIPDDVLVTEVTAGGVPARWLAAPGAGTGRVLLFLHGGGYEPGSLRPPLRARCRRRLIPSAGRKPVVMEVHGSDGEAQLRRV